MFRMMWRTFLAEKVARSVEARNAPAIEARIDSALQRIESVIAEMQASDHQRAMALERARAEIIQDDLTQATERLRTEIRAVSDRIVPTDPNDIATLMLEKIERAQPWAKGLFVPAIGLSPAGSMPFMTYSSCSAVDFLSQDFAQLCGELARPPQYHRKLWEWVFIVHHLRSHGVVAPGKRGLGFGIGTEPLPSLFAKQGATILATDAPPDIGIKAGWNILDEYASTLGDIRVPSIIDQDDFARLVSYATCDMNDIGDAFTGFDFCWSSCCLEHLGSLEAGMEFIINSVEKTLRIGGVACHTTEFNLSSDEDTIRDGPTVIYRKQDLERLVQRLRDRGHQVDDLKIAPDHHPLDFFVDLPPYIQNPHLKLNLMGFTSTSVGLVVRRGR